MYDSDNHSFFRAPKKDRWMIEDLNISVHEGEILALVGASGSGKTLLADALMGIYEPNVIVQGTIWFDGAQQTAASLTTLRGRGISLVPQSITHLDPLMKVGKQLLANTGRGRQLRQRLERINELLTEYRLDTSVLELYPFELSGGMARRVLLLTALLDEPQLIIADEPTPGLDLPLAIKAMEDFRRFANTGKGVLLITHDIELALKVADRVAVFKDGTVVEETSVDSFASPDTLRHPFSRQLWHALPEHDFIVMEANE
jgi:peptide/nickel transport system ATP-binding protein